MGEPSRARQVAWTLLKAAVLVAVLWYASSRIEWDDALAPVAGDVRVPGAPSLVVSPGTPVHLVAETPGAYRVRDGSGRQADVPRAWVDGPEPTLRRLPGVRSLARGVDARAVALAWLLFGPALFLGGVRWLALLRGCHVRIGFGAAIRLHFLGLFFNTFLPGGTGGDIAKSVAVARQTDRKAEAVGTVLADRVLGLYVLLAAASLVAAFEYDALRGVARQVGPAFAGLTAASFLFFSERFRHAIRLERWLPRLPGGALLQRADAALFGLRRRPGALLRAVAANVALLLVSMAAIDIAGHAVGIDRATLRDYVVLVPIGYVVNAFPLSFGGLGLMEGAFLKLFDDAGLASPAQGFALGLLVRLLNMAWTLPAGLLLLVGRRAETGSPAPGGPGDARRGQE